MTQERIAEMEKQLQELSKQLAEIKQGQAQEYKAGQWVIATCKGVKGEYLVRLRNPNEKEGQFITPSGDWDGFIGIFDHLVRPATPEEIKNALTEVCKRKGIVPGAKIKQPRKLVAGESYGTANVEHDKEYYHEKVGSQWVYVKETDTLFNYGWGLGIVYSQGQFAEVVKEPEEKITICGKEIEFTNLGIEINGQEYYLETLKALQRVLDIGQVKYLAVGCNAQERVDLQTINKILKRLEK